MSACNPPRPAAAPPPSQAPEIGEAAGDRARPPRPPVSPDYARAARYSQRRARPQKPAPAAKAPRVSRIGDDFLKGIADAPAAAKAAARCREIRRARQGQRRPADRRSDPPLRAPAARARGRRQPHPGRRSTCSFIPSGRLKRSPTVVGVSGDDDENAQFVDLVVNQAIASYRQCSPLRLPAELYQTPQGGWANINMRYRVP